MRVAVIGKGGAGKSVIAGTLARLFARRGHAVLALDVDTMPGMALSLGLGAEAAGDGGLPEDLGERQEGRGWVLKDGVDVAALVASHAVAAPDGVRFLQLGKLPGRVKPGSTTAFRAVMKDFRPEGWSLVADLAAGTRQPFFGWGDFAEVVLVVADPSAKAVLTARRLAALAWRTDEEGEERPAEPQTFWLVANKVRGARDTQAVEEGLREQGLPLVAAVPWDARVAEAERAGLAPIDAAAGSEGLAAIERLAETLERQFGRGMWRAAPGLNRRREG